MPAEAPLLHILVLVLDLGGTFVFAISGAIAAVKHRFDIFGVLVLAFVAGNTGGITRDLLIGAIPPAAVADWKYLTASVVAGLITFFWSPLTDRYSHGVLWFDAVGLAFFAVSGAEKALAFGLAPAMAALLGMVTGIGGGMLRDILSAEIPAVLRSDLYALAALAGAVVVVVGHALHFLPIPTVIVGGVLCFALRFMAIHYGWHLPRARQPREQSREEHSSDSYRRDRRHDDRRS
jgi:uncharacterized membrane protein YeiH